MYVYGLLADPVLWQIPTFGAGYAAPRDMPSMASAPPTTLPNTPRKKPRREVPEASDLAMLSNFCESICAFSLDIREITCIPESATVLFDEMHPADLDITSSANHEIAHMRFGPGGGHCDRCASATATRELIARTSA